MRFLQLEVAIYALLIMAAINGLGGELAAKRERRIRYVVWQWLFLVAAFVVLGVQIAGD